MTERSAQSVLLELLSAVPEGLPATALIDGCGIMGVSSNGVRVTLSRLKRRDLIETAGRGFYRLGPAARPVQDVVSGWRDLEGQLCAWQGAWVAVHTAAVPKSERRAMRMQQQAFRLFGFRELTKDLHVRPDNLHRSVAQTRQGLHELGLDLRAVVFHLAELDEKTSEIAQELWDARALVASYRKLTRDLNSGERRLAKMRPARAARDAFVLGSGAIRRIVADPMLPEPIVDTKARSLFFAAMRRFDTFGRKLWRHVLTGEEQACA